MSKGINCTMNHLNNFAFEQFNNQTI